MREIRKKLIVVLGMHRSGTSALTRGMQVLGASLGDKLYQPAMDNEKGYWEDIDINSFNVELLSAIESDWFYLSQVREFHLDKFRREGYLLRGVDLIRKKINEVNLFCFKDPRTSRLLPFWKEVFSYCQVEVGYVLAIRNPLSVVKSLEKRNKFTAEHSYLLWLGHILECLNGTIGSMRVLVDFDFLMRSPDTELLRIAKSLNLTVDPVELHTYQSDFIDERLRHTIFNSNDLLLDDACPAIVYELYSKLIEVASGQIDLNHKSLSTNLTCWVKEFERLKECFSFLDKLLAQNLAYTQKIAMQDGVIDCLSQAIGELDTQIGQDSSESQSYFQFESALNKMDTGLEKLTGHVRGLINAANQRGEETIQLKQAIRELEVQIAQVRTGSLPLDSIRSKLEDIDLGLGKLVSHIVCLISMANEKDEEITKFNQELGVLDDQIAQVRTGSLPLDSIRSKLEDIDPGLGKLVSHIVCLISMANEKDEEIAKFNQELGVLGDQIAQIFTRLHSLNSLKVKLNEVDPRLEKIKSYIGSLFNRADECGGEIVMLNHILIDMEEQASKTNQMFSLRNDHIINAKSGLEKLDATEVRIIEFNPYIKNLDSCFSALSQMLSDCDSQIDKWIDEVVLRGKYALLMHTELKEMGLRLDALTSSNSWRMTMPLRNLSRWLKSSLHQG